MPALIKMTLALDPDSYESAKTKRPFSTSQLVKFWLKILLHSEKQLVRMKHEDEEFRAILEYVTPKVKRIFEE